MISYIVLFAASYLGLFSWLPIFQNPLYLDDIWAQSVRHMLLLYLSTQLANFVWRQRFVSSLSG